MKEITVDVIKVLAVLVIDCKACLFSAISSEMFDHCKLYTTMTINFVQKHKYFHTPYISFWG